MGYSVVGLYFLRFWKQSRDRLFAFFAVAFWILAVQRFSLSLIAPNHAGAEEGMERQLIFYCLRLLAFVLILAAIIDKNRVRR